MYQIIDEKVFVHDNLKERMTNFNRTEFVLLEKNTTKFYETVK